MSRDEAIAKIRGMTRDEYWALDDDARLSIAMGLPNDVHRSWFRYVHEITPTYIPPEPEELPPGRIRLSGALPPARPEST